MFSKASVKQYPVVAVVNLKTKDSELCSGAVARKAKVSVAGV
jgi:hypothetical protein